MALAVAPTALWLSHIISVECKWVAFTASDVLTVAAVVAAVDAGVVVEVEAAILGLLLRL